MSGKLEKRVAYNYNIQSAYIMSAKGELYNLVELLGNAGITVTTSGLINIARCGDSRIGEEIAKPPNFEGDVEEVVDAREFLGEVYENLKERLDTLYKELYAKVKKIEYVYIQHEGNPIELEHVKANSDGRILRIDGNTIKENNTLKSVGQNGNVVVYCINNNKENISVENLDGLTDEQLSLYGIRKINIPLSEELRGLPNGVHDSIEVRDNGLFLIKRVESVPYTTGDENLSDCITNGTITYKAKSTPTEKYLDNQIPIEDYVENLNLNTYEGTTYIQSENSIKPVFYFKANTDKYAVNLEGKDIKIENSRVGKVEDLVIKGETYQNLVCEDLFSNEDRWITEHIGGYSGFENSPVLNGNSITAKSKNNDHVRMGARFTSAIIKPNTKYTIIFNIISNNLTGTFHPLYYNSSLVDFNPAFSSSSFVINPKETGIFKYVINSKSDLNDCNVLLRSLIRPCETNDETITYNYMILEGDWTNEELPEYINGIETVGNKSKNLFNYKSEALYDSNHVKIEYINDGIRHTATTDVDVWRQGTVKIRLQLKPNTLYTFHREVITSPNYDQNCGNIDFREGSHTFGTYSPLVKTPFVFRTLDTGIVDFDFQNFTFDANIPTVVVEFKHIYLCEGEYNEIKYEPYYESKIEILSHGKNLFDMNRFPNEIKTGITEFKNDFNGTITGKFINQYNTTYSILIGVKEKQRVIISAIAKGCRLIMYDTYKTDGTYWGMIDCTNWKEGEETIIYRDLIIDKNSTIRIETPYADNSKGFYIKNICVEPYVNGERHYEPYKENKTQILLDEPLMKLPNGVCDEIVNGKLIRRVGKVVLDGSEDWIIQSTNSHGIVNFEINCISNSEKEDSCMCDNFCFGGVIASVTTECYRMTKGKIYIRKIASNFSTIDSFKSWLQQNPTTIYYELARPIETELNINLDIDTYQDVTYISCDTNVKPTLSLKANGNIEEEFSGEDIAINESKNGSVRDIIIKGKTIVDTTQNKMISVGEAEGNKINILSRNGKSLLDTNMINWESGSIDGQGGTLVENASRIRTKNLTELPIKQGYLNIKYLGNYKLAIRFYREDKTFINGNGRPFIGFLDEGLMELPDGAYYYTLLCAKKRDTDVISPQEITNCNCQIEILESASSQIPYEINKKDFLLPITNGLKSLPNGTCDTIEQREDGIYLMQRVEKVEYTEGDENLSDCMTDGTITYKAKEITAEYKLGLYPYSFNPITMFEGKNIVATSGVKAPLVIEVEQPRNPAIADIINGQDEVRKLQDLNRAYMSNLREDMQNINHEADATNLDLDMRLLMLEMEMM